MPILMHLILKATSFLQMNIALPQRGKEMINQAGELPTYINITHIDRLTYSAHINSPSLSFHILAHGGISV